MATTNSYKPVWDNTVVGENLLCEREVGNHHDTHAVAVKKIIDGNLTVVGPSYGSFLMFRILPCID